MFEKMSSQEVVKSILQVKANQKDFHLLGMDCVDNMMKDVLLSKSMDNLTAVMITFKEFFNIFNESKGQSKKYLFR